MHQTKKNTLKNTKLPKLNIQQQIDNQEIVERMNRKIGFSKNPRHLGQTITYAEALDNTQSNNNKFGIEPAELFFSGYQSNHLYESELKLVNNSKYIQRIKLTPFQTKEFVIAGVKYPRETSGDIAPGMSVIVTVRFRPSSLGDFQDQLIVIIADAVIKIPVVAHRERCDIVWPKKIELGHCWVGDTIRKEIVLKNKGGDASFQLLDVLQNQQNHKIGFFKVSPTEISFQKNSTRSFWVEFLPEVKGRFQEKIRFKSHQGEKEEIEILLQGGAYNAQIVLSQLKGEQLIEQRSHNSFVLDTELDCPATATLKVKNLAVVQVDYFWNCADSIKIDMPKGKMKPSETITFTLTITSRSRLPQQLPLELYLHNLPEKSLAGNPTKLINGIEAIQCLTIALQTRPIESSITIEPLYLKITEPLYKNFIVKEHFTIVNASSTTRTYQIDQISTTPIFQAICEQPSGSLPPFSSKTISFNLKLTELTDSLQKACYLISYDNHKSQMFTLEGKSKFPSLSISDLIYYGLLRTHTLNRKYLVLSNPHSIDVRFRLINAHRFTYLDFYDFYEFEDELAYKKRFNIYRHDTGKELTDSWEIIAANSNVTLDCCFNVMDAQSAEFNVQLQVDQGNTVIIRVLAEVQDAELHLSRSDINLRQIYKGNIYNSNKFLSRELQLVNPANLDCAFEIVPPQYDRCLLKIQPLKGIIPPHSFKRIDVTIEPIQTGAFDLRIPFKYYDDFKVNSDLYPEISEHTVFNEIDGKKELYKSQEMSIHGVVKGMEMNYYLKDETKVKRVRQKVQDLPQSVKMSSTSFKSSKNLLQNEKLVYPVLQELTFYNCEINQVKQVEIIIENDSGLTTEYELRAQTFYTLEKPVDSSRKSEKGLVSQVEEVFSSQMGKNFMKTKQLDRSQKVHLSNNKGISILCEPSFGILHKKQTQKILITMFNDTSGRFRDNLIIDIRNHEKKKIPIDIHIRGTPVALSRNQLGIDFSAETPLMNLGTVLHSNGVVRKMIKIVNNGPKEVQLSWKIYPHNQTNGDRDLFNLTLKQAQPGTDNICEVKWQALKPEIDEKSVMSIEPKEKMLKGRQETVFNLVLQEIKQIGKYSNLLVCVPYLIDSQNRTEMETLAVVAETEAIEPFLTMDVKHSNHINKLQKFACKSEEYETTSSNHLRTLKLKNLIRTNLTFDIQLNSPYFKIINTRTNSPATLFSQNQPQKSFVLTFDSIIEVQVELLGNPSNHNEWPLQQKIRRQGQLIISYSNGREQVIDLVGWLYRPFIMIQMPNNQPYSNFNQEIDFGIVHVKNSHKISFYLLNSSKVDAQWKIEYIKYHQSIKYKFEQTLWTAQDYEDQNIQDEKKCWRVSLDQGVVRKKTIPVHYIPGTLALPAPEDHYSMNHKPVQITFMFKPQTNLLYKSKFRVSVAEGLVYDIVVRGRGTFEEELEKK